jgi:hypothetical protein
MNMAARDPAKMTHEELGEAIADLDKVLASGARSPAVARRDGWSHRDLARLIGYSRSVFYREFAGPIDAIVSQMGQDKAENDRLLSEWASQMGPVLFAPSPPPRRPSLPKESEGARLMACLKDLERLTNRHPAEIVAGMPPDMRDEAMRLAERASEWLAATCPAKVGGWKRVVANASIGASGG